MLGVDEHGLLAHVDDIKVLTIDVLNIGRVLLRDETRRRRLLVIRFEVVAILAILHLLKLFNLLIVVVRVLLELLNCLLVNVRHVQVVHVESLEFLQVYRACILLGFEGILQSGKHL